MILESHSSDSMDLLLEVPLGSSDYEMIMKLGQIWMGSISLISIWITFFCPSESFGEESSDAVSLGLIFVGFHLKWPND